MVDRERRDGAVCVRLFGPVSLHTADDAHDPGPPQQRLLLATLAEQPGRPLPPETVIDRLWDTAPNGARRTLHVLVTRLRAVLRRADPDGGSIALRRLAGCYQLDIDPDRVDVARFRALVQAAREPHRAAADRQDLFSDALGLWTGEPVAGLSGRWADRIRSALQQERVQATVEWGQAAIDAGRPETVTGPLAALADDHPLTESLTAVLMLALRAAGRPADALARYAETRRRLADELGTEPGTHLHSIYLAALRDPSPADIVGDGRPVPRQLPGDVPALVGRDDALAAVSAALGGADAGGPVVISAIGGMGGVGKTSLALHWAHRNAQRFPDGQLFVNLRGFDPSGEPLTPDSAIHGFLDALGVASAPRGLDARVGLYRSLVAGRSLLVVLDNARDTEQVLPLLPGSPSCAVIVTSRNRLTGLVSQHGAHVLTLDVLDAHESRQVLSGRVGADRIAAESSATAAIVDACGGLPLALAIAAARVSVGPPSALAAVAVHLGDATTRIGALDVGGTVASLRAVLASSYAALDAGEARVAALLGLIPGVDVTLAAVAALTGHRASDADRTLGSLERHSLVTQHRPGRWRMHDLVRLDAAERAVATIPAEDRRAALNRLVDHMVATAVAAAIVLTPRRPMIARGFVAEATTAPADLTAADAMRWLIEETPALIAVQRLAVDLGRDSDVWQIAWAGSTANWRRGQDQDEATMCRNALAAAERDGDPCTVATVRVQLAKAYALVGSSADSIDQAHRAIATAAQIGDVFLEARAHRVLGYEAARRFDFEPALAHARRAKELFDTLPPVEWRGEVLCELGHYSTQTGRYDEARAHLEAGLAVAREDGNRMAEGLLLGCTAYLHRVTGRHEEALAYHQRSIPVFRELGDTHNEATEHSGMAFAYAALDRIDEARAAQAQAVRMFRSQHRTADVEMMKRLFDGP